MSLTEYAQLRIEREALATKIALLLFRYTTISWSPENIKRHVKESQEQINKAIDWLRLKNYLEGRTIVYLTGKGNEFIDGLKRNTSTVTASTERKFKNEALQGITERKHLKHGWMISEQSTISAAALPGAHTPATNTTPEKMFEQKQQEFKAKQSTAARLGLSVDEFEAFCGEGRIRLCNICNSVEMFDRKGKDRWQPACRKCRRKGRI